MARHEKPQAEDLQTPWDQLVALVGDEASIRLSREMGGREIHVPQKPGEHHPITVAIGAKAAKALAKAFGGARFNIPLSPGKRARIIELDGLGWKRGRIAREVRCTERHVYAVLADAREPHPDLFT